MEADQHKAATQLKDATEEARASAADLRTKLEGFWTRKETEASEKIRQQCQAGLCRELCGVPTVVQYLLVGCSAKCFR